MHSALLETYINDLAVQNSKTATVSKHFLADYSLFVSEKYASDLDTHVKNLRSGKADVYDVLRAYVHHLDQTN